MSRGRRENASFYLMCQGVSAVSGDCTGGVANFYEFPYTYRMKKKYKPLLLISWFLKLGAWISLISGFIVFFAILFGGTAFIHMLQDPAPYKNFIAFGKFVTSFVVLAGFILNTLFLYAASNAIHLFIDIEMNTRKTAVFLEQQQNTRIIAREEPRESPIQV